MKHRYYNYFYAANMLIIIGILVFVPLSDFWQMICGGYVIILTSIFTYSNRRAIPRTKD